MKKFIFCKVADFKDFDCKFHQATFITGIFKNTILRTHPAALLYKYIISHVTTSKNSVQYDNGESLFCEYLFHIVM